MTSSTTGERELSPLDGLLAILPLIEKAKERDRLGEALQKATVLAERYAWMPDRLEDLAILLGKIIVEENTQKELRHALGAVIEMAKTLSVGPSLPELVSVNQEAMPQLPLRIEKIEEQVESLWRVRIEHELGNQASLGKILSAIPGVESLGRDVSILAARMDPLTDVDRRAHDRVAELDEIVDKLSAMEDRLLNAGVARPIADFLVTVTAGPIELSNLTEEIFEWIRKHKALQLFAVSTRRP